jgi:glycosyltransferase involved in cell wall biosynthesis
MSNDIATPKVSYILLTKNRPDFLATVLDNIRQFIRPEDELIVVDGGSAEEPGPVIERNRDIVTQWILERESCIEEAVNLGIRKSSGELVVNLSDDDYFYPDGVRAAVETMEKRSELDALVCGGEYTLLDPETNQLKVIGHQWVPPGQSLQSNWELIFKGCSAGFLLVRRSAILKYGLYDKAFKASDTEYMSRLIARGAMFKYLDVKYFRHVSRPQSQQNLHSTRAMEDRAMIALRHRSWEAFRSLPPEVLADVLGLSKVKGGRDVMAFIQFADVLRVSFPPVLKLFGAMVRALGWILALARRAAAPSGQVPLTEPIRDGGLR